MNKKIKKGLLGLLLIVLVLAGYGFYMYTKRPADIRKETVVYEISATALLAEFNRDEPAAGKKYIDKVIAVKGKVADIKTDTENQTTVFLDTGDLMASVTCSFYQEETSVVKLLRQGQEVTIKGKCTGKLMDVVLNKCSINK